jgi:hypothetical protein
MGNVHRIHGGKDCIEGSRFDCLPERLTPFYDGFRKVGLLLPKLATGFELRIFRYGKEFRRFTRTIILSRLAS